MLSRFDKTQTAPLASQLMETYAADEVCDKSEPFAADTPLDTLRKHVWYWAAEYFYATQDYAQSVRYGNKALPLCRETAWEADCLNILSLAYFRQSDFDKAADFAKQCYKLDEKSGDPDVMSSSLNSLAGIYLGANQPHEAEHYILKAIEQANKVDNPARMAVLQGTASEIYHQMGNDEEAVKYANRACEIEEQRGDLYKLAVRRTQKSSVLLGLDDYAEAERLLNEAILVFRKVGDRHSLGIALNKLGMALHCQQRQAEAVGKYREAEQIFVEMGDLTNEMHSQRGLYESYWNLNPDSAKLALDRFDLLKDSLYSNATAESMARFNAEFGSDYMHRENEHLRTRTRNYIIGILCVALLLIAGIWMWLKHRMRIRESALQAIIDDLQDKQTLPGEQSSVDESDMLSQSDRDFLGRLVMLVRDKMQESDISVESLASELCVTRGQLNRRMKNLTGVTTQQYVMRIRMEQARLLLSSRPEKSVSEVAYQCGFSDPASFSRAFRQTFNITPSQCREGKTT